MALLFSAFDFGEAPQAPAPPQAPNAAEEKTPNVTISLVGQTLKTDPYWKKEYALLQFRLENQSDRDVIVYGWSDDEQQEVRAVGYSLRYDKQTQQWLYPTPDNSPIKWEKVKERVSNYKALAPKKEVMINLTMRYERPRELVKSVLYVAFYGGKVVELVSPEFILK